MTKRPATPGVSDAARPRPQTPLELLPEFSDSREEPNGPENVALPEIAMQLKRESFVDEVMRAYGASRSALAFEEAAEALAFLYISEPAVDRP